MLGITDPLRAWAERDKPTDAVWRRVAEMVFTLGNVPWRSPSYPVSFPEGQFTEIRGVDVPRTNITITYEHHHQSGLVDLLLVAAEGS